MVRNSGNDTLEVRVALLEEWRDAEVDAQKGRETWIRSLAVAVFGSMATMIAKGFGWF